MNNSISKAKQIFDQIQQKKRLQKVQNIFKVINIDNKKNDIYVKQRFYFEHRLQLCQLTLLLTFEFNICQFHYYSTVFQNTQKKVFLSSCACKLLLFTRRVSLYLFFCAILLLGFKAFSSCYTITLFIFVQCFLTFSILVCAATTNNEIIEEDIDKIENEGNTLNVDANYPEVYLQPI